MRQSRTLKLLSPAKINLYLKVLSRRTDGFHELDSLFERISLADEIVLKKTDSEISFYTNDPDIPKNSQNLAVKAALLLREECDVKQGVAIYLKKRIPVAAGLGGGSSNAATVLLGLNVLWSLRLSKKKLLKLASRLGSDVPFFILEEPYAFATGRGEILKPARGIRSLNLWHCLVKPHFGISTKEAYQGLKPGFLTPQKVNVKMLIHFLQKGDFDSFSGLLVNSLELVLNKRLKTILNIKKRLVSEGAFASLMSGSGSAVFGLFRSEKQALQAASRMRKKNKRWQIFVASTYAHSGPILKIGPAHT